MRFYAQFRHNIGNCTKGIDEKSLMLAEDAAFRTSFGQEIVPLAYCAMKLLTTSSDKSTAQIGPI